MSLSKLITGLLLGLLLLLGSCALPGAEDNKAALRLEEQGSAPSPAMDLKGKITNPVFGDNVHDITQFFLRGEITCTADQAVFTWHTATPAFTLAAGDILYAVMEDDLPPLVRKITGITNGNSKLSIRTCAAALFDLYKSYSFSMSVPLTAADLTRLEYPDGTVENFNPLQARSIDQVYCESKIVKKFTDWEICDGVNVSGNVGLWPSLDINWTLVNNRLTAFQAVTSIRFESNLIFDITLANAEFAIEVPYCTAIFAHIVTPVGTFSPELAIVFGISGEVTANVSFGARIKGNIIGGCEYKNGLWHPIGDKELDADFYNNSCNLAVTGTLKAYTGPKLDFKFVTPTGKCLGAFVYMRLSTEAQYSGYVVDFFYRAVEKAGVKTDLLEAITGLPIPGAEFTVLDEKVKIGTVDVSANAPEPLRIYFTGIRNLSAPSSYIYKLDVPLDITKKKKIVMPLNSGVREKYEYCYEIKNVGPAPVTLNCVTSCSTNKGLVLRQYEYYEGCRSGLCKSIAPYQLQLRTTIPPVNPPTPDGCLCAYQLQPCQSIYLYMAAGVWGIDKTVFTVKMNYRKSGASSDVPLDIAVWVMGSPSKDDTAPENPFSDDIVIGLPSNIPEPFPTPDIAPLPAPVNLSASRGSYTNKVLVQWNDVENATHYKVFKVYGTNANPNAYSTYTACTGWITATSFTDTDTNPGTNYYYIVKAAGDTNGYRESTYSGYDYGWRALTAPVIKAGDGLAEDKITLTWNNVPGAKYYKVFRSETVSGRYVLFGTIASPWLTLDDTTALATKRYYYKAAASLNSNGYRMSAYSQADSGFRKLMQVGFWYATDETARLDVLSPLWSMGEFPHWNQIYVYNTDTNASLGKLSRYHVTVPLYNKYYPGSTTWPGSTYRYHGTLTAFQARGLPRYVKVNFMHPDNTVYSVMSNSVDLQTGRSNLAHGKPVILHDGDIYTLYHAYSAPNDWLQLNDGDWSTDWFVNTNSRTEASRTKATIDLGSSRRLTAFRYSVYWDYSSYYGATAGIRIKVSADNITWQVIDERSVSRNQVIASTISAINARYVMIEWLAESTWHGWGGIRELEVYGY